MQHKKAVKLTGFVGALCASAALVSVAATSTGAYFSDSKNGSISASSGHLTLNANQAAMNLNWANLMPGENRDKAIDYSVDVSSGGVDVWLVFDPSSAGYQAFTGGKGSPLASDGGLGRYGYFKVADSNGGQAFVTGNLAYPDGTNTWASGMCPTDTNGRGGSADIADTVAEKPPWCGVPAKILLASDVASGHGGTVTMTFGLNGVLQTQQNQTEPSVGFKLVATQHGQTP